MKELKEKIVWVGEHRGVTFEIQKFHLGEKPCWAFYLYVHLDRLPSEIAERFWLDSVETLWGGTHYDYDSEPLMAGLDWHCGITWYSKEAGFDESPRYVKIGCDYNHYCDEGRYYDEKYVASEAERCIDSLWSAIPEMKLRCPLCGKNSTTLEPCEHCERETKQRRDSK